MAKWLVMGLCMLGTALPLAAYAQANDCACIHNRANRLITFKHWYKNENGTVYNDRLDPDKRTWICWNEGLFGNSRSEVFVQLDSALVAPGAKAVYDLRLGDSPMKSCDSTPASSHYAFRPDPANPIYLTLNTDSGGNNAPATPTAPAYPYPAPPQGYPQPTYPAPVYAPPAPGYSQPPPVYPQPAPAYNPSAPAYAPPAPGYPAPAYAPPGTYPSAPPSYPAPVQGYPQPTYPAPQPGFVPATPAQPGATRPPLF